MTYLIAKYLFLLLLATVFGFLLGRWWVRRQFVDVSEAYEGFRRTVEAAEQAPWGKLFSRIDGMAPLMRKTVRSELDAQPAIEFPTVDLSGIDARLQQVDARFNDIPVPEVVDLSLTNQKVNDLEKAIRAMPVPKDPEPVDLAGVNDRLNELSASVRAFPQQIPQAKPVDLSALDRKFSSLNSTLSAFETSVPAAKLELGPLDSRLGALESAVRSIAHSGSAQNIDLEPTNQRIGAIEVALRTLPKATELQPVGQRLSAIEESLKQLIAAQQNTPAVVQATAPARSAGAMGANSEPLLLKSASFGAKDDLKKISGVGPMLEDLLNRQGVYYFWQIADWTDADIELMDAKIGVFKGRIERDEWVKQAGEFTRKPGTADRP